MIKEYLKLLKFLKGHEKVFGLAIVFMFLSALVEGIQIPVLVPVLDRIFTDKMIVLPNSVPPLVAFIVDTLNQMQAKHLFWIVTAGIVPLLVTKHLVFYVAKYLMSRISQGVVRDVRTRLFKKIHGLSLEYFSQKRTGELISRITSDVLAVENAVSYGVTDLVRSSFLIAFYIGWAFTIYFKAALIVFVLLPAIAWPVSILGRRLRKIAKGFQEKMADVNSHLLETISGVRVVKAFCMEEREIKKFYEQSHQLFKLNLQSVRRILMVSPVTEIFGGVAVVVLLVVFGKPVMAGELSFGVFLSFLASMLLVISPVKKLGNVYVIMQHALAANKRIYEVFDTEVTVKEKENPVSLNSISKGIVFNDVDFSYDNDAQVLSNINLTINAGELVAIVGPTGTGKSTLVNLIPRFYDPTKGSITIDDHDLKDVSFNSLRQQIGMVTQETFLFNDTVANNIGYGQDDINKEAMVDAAQKAFAHQFIESLPKGYDTVVGDRGFRLSGGEKQRLTIARAILKNPPILILDEATSQLDSESEKFVQEALDQLMEDRTVIAIAHRLSTILKADKIVVLDKGGVVGCDKHENLLESCPLYKRLYQTQFQQ